ncbi:MAG TPA: alpha/beta hydrolase [Acidimicrobiia bacterium]|nr:alpha/beta hydrolase [Acidimicrobiia bacterium]
MTTAPQTEPVSRGLSSERPPLLFVHGAWGGAWLWDDFIPWFTERGWECHAFDLRHHGDRGGPKTLRRTRIKDYVDDLAAAVAKLPRPPIIVGLSMGALVTQRYLEHRTLPGAVLMAPVPLGGVWRATVRTAHRHPFKFLQANLMLDLGKAMDSPGPVKSMLMDDDATDEQVADLVARTGGESYLAYLDMLFVTRARPQLVQTPVAIVLAERDSLFSVKEGRKLAGAYGVDPIVVPGIAHQMPSSTRWQSAAEAVEEALRDLI